MKYYPWLVLSSRKTQSPRNSVGLYSVWSGNREGQSHLCVMGEGRSRQDTAKVSLGRRNIIATKTQAGTHCFLLPSPVLICPSLCPSDSGSDGFGYGLTLLLHAEVYYAFPTPWYPKGNPWRSTLFPSTPLPLVAWEPLVTTNNIFLPENSSLKIALGWTALWLLFPSLLF